MCLLCGFLWLRLPTVDASCLVFVIGLVCGFFSCLIYLLGLRVVVFAFCLEDLFVCR